MDNVPKLYTLLLTCIVFSIFNTGCATVQKQPQVILTPVQTPCVETVPQKPAIKSDAELKALGDYELVITALAERYRLILWGDELSAVLEGCK